MDFWLPVDQSAEMRSAADAIAAAADAVEGSYWTIGQYRPRLEDNWRTTAGRTALSRLRGGLDQLGQVLPLLGGMYVVPETLPYIVRDYAAVLDTYLGTVADLRLELDETPRGGEALAGRVRQKANLARAEFDDRVRGIVRRLDRFPGLLTSSPGRRPDEPSVDEIAIDPKVVRQTGREMIADADDLTGRIRAHNLTKIAGPRDRYVVTAYRTAAADAARRLAESAVRFREIGADVVAAADDFDRAEAEIKKKAEVLIR